MVSFLFAVFFSAHGASRAQSFVKVAGTCPTSASYGVGAGEAIGERAVVLQRAFRRVQSVPTRLTLQCRSRFAASALISSRSPRPASAAVSTRITSTSSSFISRIIKKVQYQRQVAAV